MAARAAVSAADWAANGVLLREPRKFSAPVLDHETVLPCVSVMVTMVLLKVLWICAAPLTMFLRSLRLVRVFAPALATSELLACAAAAEYSSIHPLAKAITAAAGEGAFDPADLSEISEIRGRGRRALLGGRVILAGNAALMREQGVEIPPEHQNPPSTAVYLARDGAYLGMLTLFDPPKPQSAEAIAALKAQGIGTVMLSGDSARSAQAAAARLGVDECLADLLPGDKVSALEKFIAKGVTAFVGDGINDSPSLARADIGFAMGTSGADAAIEAADVVLVGDNPDKIPRAVEIARRTMRIARQNIAFALSVKLLVLILSLFGLANMWMAVFADVGVSVLAILNSMRTLK